MASREETPCKWCGRVRDLHYDFGAMWCEEIREGHKFEADLAIEKEQLGNSRSVVWLLKFSTCGINFVQHGGYLTEAQADAKIVEIRRTLNGNA
jgi:hypothetical protein